MKKRIIFYHLGNFLMLTSLISLIYIFYPVVKMYLLPPNKQIENQVISNGFNIAIPKIHAYSNVIANVNPWIDNEYKEALKKGVAHAKGTKLPGENGTTFLFAHSSGSPWDLTYTNTIFLRLAELDNGDYIKIDYKGKRYSYKVADKKEVWPTETEYLTGKINHDLILQTCTPIGTSLKRLLIFADQVE